MPDPDPSPDTNPPPGQRPPADDDEQAVGFPPVFVGEQTGPPPRSSVQSMFMMMLFFFFMSNGNQPSYTVGGDGEIRPRLTELAVLREQVGEYEGWLNGTGNWTEPPVPEYLASSLVPEKYDHAGVAAQGGHFYPNITGSYRRPVLHNVDLREDPVDDSFFRGVALPEVNKTASWNSTLATGLRGEYDWAGVTNLDFKLTERRTTLDLAKDKEELHRRDVDWSWVRGTLTLSGNETVEYNMYGLHFIPNGTYELYAMPDGLRVDVRHIPTLYPHAHNATVEIVRAELKRELEKAEDSFLLTDVNDDYPVDTHCPLLMHLSLPPLPPGLTLNQVLEYERELANPTGILGSLKRPRGYWEGEGLGGVIVGEQCGFVIGFDKGQGVPLDNFWRKTIHYSAFATLSQVIVLLLLVKQMERTRTPSTLAKVSLWTIIMISMSESAIFSGHLVLGLLADNKTSLPLLIPCFLALCTAVVFGPRYAVMLHRIQAPERAIARPEGDDNLPWIDRAANLLEAYPGLRWLGSLLLLFIFIYIIRVPATIPFAIFATQSIWLPQIYRNARRGSSGGLGYDFIIGTTIGRLGIPLYALACPENIFFVDNADWIYLLILWQIAQVLVLFAQDRFGPAFFLPKRFAPPEGYNYHPVLTSDIESSTQATCSICMEDVNTQVSPLNARKSYAVAPCHHLFHTKCLQQWMAIKTICPLCKRPLPPL